MKLVWDFEELYDFADRITNQTMFDKYLEEATKEISMIFHRMLINNTPMDTGKLRSGWVKGANLAYNVKKVDGGYEVEFTNDVEYARWVNYGHRVKNQGDGPYYKVKRRTVPYHDGNNSDYFVYGHFFVEKTALKMVNGSHQIDNIVHKELEKWLRWCING